MRCHYHKDTDGKKYLIPGCWSVATNGRDDMFGCTCYKPKHIVPTKPGELKNEELERECRKLQAINDKLNARNKVLQEENAELRRAGLPLDVRRAIDSGELDGSYNAYYAIKHYLDKRNKINER